MSPVLKALRLALGVLGFWLASFANHSDCQEVAKSKTDRPEKADLIKALDAILPLLESKDYAAAAKHVVMPPGMDPDQLNGLLSAREISAAGIRQLERDAKFGKATEVFEKERGTHLAGRFGSDVDQCWGFNHETKTATAEVIGHWDGLRFRLVRIDDIGKLEGVSGGESSPEATEIKNPDSPPMTEFSAEAIAKAAQAIPGLTAAVEKSPRDVGAKAELAMAYFKIGNTPEAWKQLMAGYQLDSKHQGIAKGIDSLIGAFTKQGVFSVGVPSETIQGLLGDPTQKLDIKKRLRWAYAHWGIDFVDNRVTEIIDLRGVTNSLYNPTEIIQAKFGEELWRPGFRRKSKGRQVVFYFLPGESISSYTRMIAIERWLGVTQGKQLEEVGKEMITQEAKLVPGSKHKILKATDEAMYIAVMIPSPGENKPRFQLVRFFKGPQDLHRLTYTVVSEEEPDRETQKKWMGYFEAAALRNVE